jgi:hypothetical protein
MDRPVINCQCLPPPQASNIPPNFRRHKQGRRSVPRPIHLRGPRQLIVVWLIFRTGIGGPIRSAHPDSARVTNPPRRPNTRINGAARPNQATPEYHDDDHGVAVGWPRRFCGIAPIAFVGGMGGWCCGALFIV